MAVLPSSYTLSPSCISCVGQNGFEETVINNIVDSFEISPNYEEVYIVPDSSVAQDLLQDEYLTESYGYSIYKSWIFDGTEKETPVGYKYIQMYPYNTPILKEGDYICWDYYKTGKKSVWFCLALDSQTIYEQLGKIRMCTNSLRFYNNHGDLISVPCVFDDKINSEKNISLSKLKYINGITTVYAQLNSDSEQIVANQRFLFGRPGSWTSFRVVSVGVNNFMNLFYNDNTSSRVLELTMEASYVNYKTDDLINGIADIMSSAIEVDIEEIENVAGTTIQVSTSVFINGIISDEPVEWSSSDDSIATVSDSGVISLLSNGSAVVTVKMSNNTDVKKDISISVVDSPDEQIEIVCYPVSDGVVEILQGIQQDFSCYLYENGVRLLDTFTFSIETDLPSSYYSFVIVDGNNFSIKNNRMDIDNHIYITCESGLYSKVVEVQLNGVW